MKIIHNKIIPFGRKYNAINLFGVIFSKGKLSPTQINHELIHTRQQIELLFLPFYLLYLIEWLFRLMQYRSFYLAYKNISFERESYDNMNDIEYLHNRKPFTWIKYLHQHPHH